MATKQSKDEHEASTSRPPIVAVLGHVDHGKTTLISKIKESDLTKKEFGGISQHIGAYQIDFQNKKITFIDTPGHVVFSQMRSRGTKVADLAILVVAADEGVKPQTVESLKHIIAAEIPYIVAINKIDLPDINLNQVKTGLAEHGVLVEGFGGQVVTVPVSAKTGQGVKELLEMILLMAEMAEIKADPKASLEAVVVESRMEKNRGTMATFIILNGALKLGQEVSIEGTVAKVKAMFNETGKNLTEALPGQPVEVLGLSFLPAAGSLVRQLGVATMTAPKFLSPQETTENIDDDKKLKIILRADTAGTLEAVRASLPQEVLILAAGVGDVSDSDILLAVTTKAEVIGFNVRTPSGVVRLAQEEKIRIKTYNIIYELLEDIEKRVLRILEPNLGEKVLGEAEIKAEFNIDKDKIAGCKVVQGELSRRDTVHLKREGKIIGESRIRSLKKGKLDADKAKKDEECGVILFPTLDFTIGDVLTSYVKEDSEE